MNKKYIKRQLTLFKLGIPMTNDIQNYYDSFRLLYDGLGKLEKKKDKQNKNIIHWCKNDNIIFTYHEDTNIFFIKRFFYEYFEAKYNMKEHDSRMILSIIVEHMVDLDILYLDDLDAYDSAEIELEGI